LSVFGEAPGDADWWNLEMYSEAIVEGKSVSYYHRYSIWQEKRAGIVRRNRVNRDELNCEEYLFGRPQGR
jgi:hypothetical protein